MVVEKTQFNKTDTKNGRFTLHNNTLSSGYATGRDFRVGEIVYVIGTAITSALGLFGATKENNYVNISSSYRAQHISTHLFRRWASKCGPSNHLNKHNTIGAPCVFAIYYRRIKCRFTGHCKRSQRPCEFKWSHRHRPLLGV